MESADGYDTLQVNLTGFENGETFTFSVDNDPTSIKGASNIHPAGPISGLELAGATVTVTYENGDTQTITLASDGSPDGAQATAKANTTAEPSLGVQNVTLESTTFNTDTTAATVSDENQTVVVNGPAGMNVTLTRVEAELNLDNIEGYDLEAYEATRVLNVEQYTATIGPDGTVELPVTYTNSTADGGYNSSSPLVRTAQATLARIRT